VSLRLRGVYLGDPVILLLSATLAGLIVFLVAGKPWIALAHGTLPRSDEFKYMTGFREGELAFIAVRIVGLNIIESFLLIGVITAVAGAYIVGMGRDQGYSALSTLLNIGRRTYIRALTLYPLILYQTSIVPGLLIAMALIDINLLKILETINSINTNNTSSSTNTTNNNNDNNIHTRKHIQRNNSGNSNTTTNNNTRTTQKPSKHNRKRSNRRSTGSSGNHGISNINRTNNSISNNRIEDDNKINPQKARRTQNTKTYKGTQDDTYNWSKRWMP
jgi:hypothetical protein